MGPLPDSWLAARIGRSHTISNPKPDLHNVKAHTMVGENPLMFTRYQPETKIWACLRQIFKIWWNLPLTIPNQISTISMHIPSLMEVHWCLLKLSSGNKILMDRWMYNWRMDRHMDVQCETIIPRHYCVVGYKIISKCLWLKFYPECWPLNQEKTYATYTH